MQESENYWCSSILILKFKKVCARKVHNFTMVRQLRKKIHDWIGVLYNSNPISNQFSWLLYLSYYREKWPILQVPKYTRRCFWVYIHMHMLTYIDICTCIIVHTYMYTPIILTTLWLLCYCFNLRTHNHKLRFKL